MILSLFLQIIVFHLSSFLVRFHGNCTYVKILKVQKYTRLLTLVLHISVLLTREVQSNFFKKGEKFYFSKILIYPKSATNSK